MRLRWQNGLFVPDDGMKANEAAQANAEIVFLNLLDAYEREERNVSSSTSPTYAPKVFADDKRGRGFGRDVFRDAMNALSRRNERSVRSW
jgi:hypothetical protein